MQFTDRQWQWLMIGVAVGMLVFGAYVFWDDRRHREAGTGRWVSLQERADAQEAANVRAVTEVPGDCAD